MQARSGVLPRSRALVGVPPRIWRGTTRAVSGAMPGARDRLDRTPELLGILTDVLVVLATLFVLGAFRC